MNSTCKLLLTTAALTAASLLLCPTQARATMTIRELFDTLGAGGSLDGKGSDATTLGLQSNVNWTVSPAGSTAITYKDTFSVDWPFGGLEYNGVLLSSSGGGLGCINVGSGNLASLIDPNTTLPYGIYSSLSFATRPLSSNAYINFQANGTYFFSYRIVKSYSWAPGDNSVGVAFASGTGTNAHFVGAGFTRPTPFLAADNSTDIGDTVFISTGTLGQAGIANHPDDTGGPYYPRAYGTAGLISSDPKAGLLVGRLTTTVSGVSTMDVKVYLPNTTPDTDPNAIVWDATYSFSETNVMTHLVLFMHGVGGQDYDAIRVGTTYGDAIGLELIGVPSGSPANTVYAGTTVTLSQYAGLNSGAFPMSFQWRSNGVAILDETNSTLVLTSPTTNFTANYSVTVSNYYGVLTSDVRHVTILPAVPPFIVTQPASITRYVGAPATTLSIVADGTPPFTYQWKHAGTNIGSATTTSDVTNKLTVGPITLADAGQYSVTITNQFGSVNSALATFTVLTPTAQSYAAAVTALSPYGYWPLNDDTNSVIYDAWGGNHGTAIDLSNINFGAAGATYVGFPANHKAIQVFNGASPSRLNLPKLVFTNAMTFAFWVNGGGQLMARNAYGNAYGLENNAGALQFDWGGITAWNSGLVVPASTWTFVALVVEPTQATIYMGTNKVSLISANSGPLTILDSTVLGDTPYLSPLALGRNPWPWADDGGGAGWATLSDTMSDVTVFNRSLTLQEVTSLYQAGIDLLQYSRSGGDLILNWNPGSTLQEATVVSGPYTDVLGATPPYTNTIPAVGNKFYRLKR